MVDQTMSVGVKHIFEGVLIDGCRGDQYSGNCYLVIVVSRD